MSESLSSLVVEDLSQADELRPSSESSNEGSGREWERDDLTPLVAANSNILGRCQWMQGAVVTLGEAMANYSGWAFITEENQDIAIAAVMEFLANPVEETEEPQEETEEKEEEATDEEKSDNKRNQKTEEQADQKNTKNETNEKKSKPEIERVKNPETQAKNIEKQPETEEPKVNKPEVGEPTKAPHVEPEHSPQAESPPDKEEKVFKLKPELAIDKPAQAIDTYPKAGHELEEPDQTQPELNNLQAGELQNAQPKSLIEDQIVDFEPARTEHTFLEPESFEGPEKDLETIYENNMDAEEETVVESLEAQMQGRDLPNIYEKITDEQPPVFYEATDLESTEYSLEPTDAEPLFSLVDKTNDSVQGNVVQPEMLVQIDSEPEEVEVFEPGINVGGEPNDIEAANKLRANEILDKITLAPQKLETNTDESKVPELEVKEELKDLLVELLEIIEIEYQPELVEKLAELILKWQTGSEIEMITIQQEINDVFLGEGTQEVIQLLLAGRGSGKATSNVFVLGKTAIQLSLEEIPAIYQLTQAA